MNRKKRTANRTADITKRRLILTLFVLILLLDGFHFVPQIVHNDLRTVENAHAVPVTNNISQAISTVSLQQVQNYMAELQNFTTRYDYSKEMKDVSKYIYDRFRQFGLKAEYDEFLFNGENIGGDEDLDREPKILRNVVGTLEGKSEINNYTIVICAHYDCMVYPESAYDDPETRAPGADNDASGITAVLVAADILSNLELNATVKFVAFAGNMLADPDRGYPGSSHYTQTLKGEEENVLAVLNMDMIGWNGTLPGSMFSQGYNLTIVTNKVSQWLADEIIEVNRRYNIIPKAGIYEPVIKIVDSTRKESDHSSFWEKGFDAVWARHTPDNPRINSLQDVYDPGEYAINLTMLQMSSKLGVATLMTLGIPNRVIPLHDHVMEGNIYHPIPISLGVVGSDPSYSVNLFVKNIGSDFFIPMPMDLDNGTVEDGIWTANIPPQAGFGYVHYYVKITNGINTYILPHDMEYYGGPAYVMIIKDLEPPDVDHNPLYSIPVNTPITISTKLTDNIGISNVTLTYAIFPTEEAITYHGTLPMNLITGTKLNGTWTATIPAQPLPAEAYYYIRIVDGSNAITVPEGIEYREKAHINGFEFLIKDVTPPVINHTSPMRVPLNSIVDINASISDDIYMREATLCFRNESQEEYKRVEMDLVAGNMKDGDWMALISSAYTRHVGIIEYYIEAEDKGGNIITSPENISIPHVLWIVDGYPPSIVHVPVREAMMGERIEIKAKIVDDQGVKNATLYYKNVSSTGDYVAVPMKMVYGTDKVGIWSASIPAQKKSGTVYYYIEAWDASNMARDPGKDEEVKSHAIKIQSVVFPIWIPIAAVAVAFLVGLKAKTRVKTKTPVATGS